MLLTGACLSRTFKKNVFDNNHISFALEVSEIMHYSRVIAIFLSHNALSSY